ncbi:thioredoxin [Candidatus Woesearchaeota archaeon]|jgi:thioredoxin|nr:thioredoxin [Candidatus Woesearchaeota archaeon]MBT5215522.1 thioredoxin [Candidatus Woesearchaeota archaeon]MBT6402243.1 thioredoxin [Candidatus Woesearchaeota archaeon]
MEEISKDNFEEKVHNNPKTVVVDFYSETCPPCKQLAPVFESVSEKLKDKADFFKIKLEGNQEIFAEYTVRSVPTVIILNQSAPVAESMGFKDEETLTNWIEENL